MGVGHRQRYREGVGGGRGGGCRGAICMGLGRGCHRWSKIKRGIIYKAVFLRKKEGSSYLLFGK